MKSENRKSAQNADAATRKDLPFQELMIPKFALTAELVRHLMPSEFPPRTRKKSSASFIATTLNKRHTAARFVHVRRFPFLRKVSPFGNWRNTGATVGLSWKSISVKTMSRRATVKRHSAMAFSCQKYTLLRLYLCHYYYSKIR